jgi:hypothetical protein
MDPKQNPLYLNLLKKLDEASNLSVLAESMLDAGEYTAAGEYNAQAKKIQDEVKAVLNKISI